MRLIVNSEPFDFILAVRAAQAHMERNKNEPTSIIVFDNGNSFLVQKRKASISVTAEAKNKP